MPKAFSDDERDAIRRQLMAAGLRRFSRSGLRAVRIDDICHDAGIAKGSFYAFFAGKEELFMAIADEREALHKAEMLAFLAAAEGSQRERAATFFDLLIGKIEQDPVLTIILEHGEIGYLLRKLGPERMRQGQEADRDFAAQAARQWQGAKIDPGDLIGLMTLMLSLAMSRKAMTEEQYRPTVALLREMFVDRLTGGGA